MSSTSQVLTSNARLLKARASKHAYIGMFIAIAAVIIATMLVAYYAYGAVTLDSMIAAQKSNASLWILNLMPFAFAVWGQYVSSMMAFEASAMVIDQTSELRAQTSALEQQAMRSATFDALTDLPNRVLMRDRLEQAIGNSAAGTDMLAVLIMDLDRFKEINDTLGHYTGDRILKQVATRLQGIIENPATLARLGGDEFGIILPRIHSSDDALGTVRKIEKALQSPFMLEGLKIDVQGSIGLAFFPEHGTDADTLLQRADVAMYISKKNHSGPVIYSPDLDEHSPRRLTLMGELRHALERDQLLLHFQPKLDIRTGEIREVEALVRWQHERHGVMAPDEFIPLAERTGLIKPLTLWVMNHCLKQYAAWRSQGLDIGIAVNLSANGLLDFELPDIVAGAMAANDVPPDRLSMEITESTIMVDTERAMEVLTRLSDMGVKLAIDDFGTGYSSLAYLGRLPVSAIKIDKSFVMDMLENEQNAKIVHATIDLGHNLGLEVIAEGVENDAILGTLRDLGCDIAQGFFLTKPLDADQLGDWLVTRERAPSH